MKFAVALIAVTFVEAISCGYPNGEELKIDHGSESQSYSVVGSQTYPTQYASYVAKSALAQQAAQAATAAQAALETKHAFLQNLEKERSRAYSSLYEELIQWEFSEKVAALASDNAIIASQQAALIKEALENAEALSEEADRAANQANQSLGSQMADIEDAKSNLQEIQRRLDAIRDAYVATKVAAQKATEFANEARQNVASDSVNVFANDSSTKSPYRPYKQEVETYFH